MSRRALAIGIAVAIALALVTGVVIWKRGQSGESTHEHTEQGSAYYCPMHPTVRSDKPGNCPICGMKLVRKTASPQTDAATQIADSARLEPGTAPVTLSTEQRVLANIRTIRVAPSTSVEEVVTTGRVTLDERRVAQVTAYTAGRIEQLFVNFVGDSVVRGKPVATMYSPDLYATQQEYLLALANRQRMRSAGLAIARSASDDLVESTRRRLQLFGMSAAQLSRLAAGGKPVFATTVVSSVSGVVTQKLVVPQQYVVQGQPLLQVADLSTVWVEADVYEQDVARVAIGQRASITTPSLPGVTLSGNIAFVQPTVTGESRTTRVRIELPNRNLQLKPDMFVSVRLSAGSGRSTLAVPTTAIVDRGLQQFVWIESSPGSFTLRKVTLGARTPDRVEVVSGLAAGEVVAIEGGFLLDSEAQLRSVAP